MIELDGARDRGVPEIVMTEPGSRVSIPTMTFGPDDLMGMLPRVVIGTGVGIGEACVTGAGIEAPPDGVAIAVELMLLRLAILAVYDALLSVDSVDCCGITVAEGLDVCETDGIDEAGSAGVAAV